MGEQSLEEVGQSHLEEEVSPDWRKSGGRRRVRFPPFHLQATKMNVIDREEALRWDWGQKTVQEEGVAETFYPTDLLPIGKGNDPQFKKAELVSPQREKKQKYDQHRDPHKFNRGRRQEAGGRGQRAGIKMISVLAIRYFPKVS